MQQSLCNNLTMVSNSGMGKKGEGVVPPTNEGNFTKFSHHLKASSSSLRVPLHYFLSAPDQYICPL